MNLSPQITCFERPYFVANGAVFQDRFHYNISFTLKLFWISENFFRDASRLGIGCTLWWRRLSVAAIAWATKAAPDDLDNLRENQDNNCQMIQATFFYHFKVIRYSKCAVRFVLTMYAAGGIGATCLNA